jgi:hypothetical protein
MNHGATAVLYGNLIQSSTPVSSLMVYETLGISSNRNSFVGSGHFEAEGVFYQTLGAFQKATGQEQLSTFVVTAITNPAEAPTPNTFGLFQNYPNPFNPRTVIRFALEEPTWTSLKVFNVTGQEVATLLEGHQSAGVHEVKFDASRLASGVYFYRLQAQQTDANRGRPFVATKKLLLLR